MTHSIDQTASSGNTVTCPKCGTSFTCSLSPTCWCTTKVVPVKVKEHLAERYKTCVCSTCLDELIVKADSGESA
ncbi:MAG: cysteine-rich CWC family protein [Chlorobiales bacterium]|nr:cysteine-rich CWC family protein [Chlorobiales bacterium]